jgi:predicted porin
VKRSMVAMCTTLSVCGVAHAQSNVTLYGIVDAGVTYTSNVKGSSLYALTSGNESGNRWGMKGSEDLGSGLKAIFTMEGGFSSTTGALGQNGTEFGRQIFVGLSSDNYGTLTLGRQYSASFSTITTLLALPAGGNWAAVGATYGSHPADNDNLDSSNRINNAIKYQSPNMHGLTVTSLYSMGGKAGNFTQNSIYDVALGYINGSVKLGAGYFFAKDPNFSFWGDKANDSTTGSNISNVIISGYASATSQQIATAGAGYTFGPATVNLVYSNVQFGGLGGVNGVTSGTSAKYSGSATLNNGEVNFQYQLSPSLFLATSYTYTRDSGADNSGGAKYQTVDAGAIYSLSKRTSLYAIGVYQKASGTNSLGNKAVADISGSSGASAGNHQVLVTVGITQRF